MAFISIPAQYVYLQTSLHVKRKGKEQDVLKGTKLVDRSLHREL